MEECSLGWWPNGDGAVPYLILAVTETKLESKQLTASRNEVKVKLR